MKVICLGWLFFLTIISSVKCVKILGIFPFSAKSHFILGNALMKSLADSGNDVTIIAPFEDNDPPKNGTYKTVYLSGFAESYKETIKEFDLMVDDMNSIIHPYMAQTVVVKYLEHTFNHTNVQKLLSSGEKFDVVIMEKFYNDALLGIAHHFQAPVVIFTAIGVSPCINSMVGNPEPFAYVRHYVTNFQLPMTFFQRIHNAYLYLFQEIVDQYYFLPKHEKLMKKYFPNTPSIYDLYHNISFVFVNGHESYSQAVPLVPNMRSIGGYHIKPPKALPQDLKSLLDNATEGVVYFSLGSNLKASHITDDKKRMIFESFGKLKETVLMKFEEDFIEKTNNVIIRKWFPQQDLLAHPNIKLFITHGGLLSTTEALYHGVPLLTIPVFADQHLNALSAELQGYARVLPYKDPSFTEENLSSLLDDLLHNPKYRETAKMRTQLFHDRPLTPAETINYWVNYVARHKGAPHLRVAGINLPWYKYHLLDIIGAFLAIILFVMFLFYKILTMIFRKSHSKTTKKLKKN